MCVLLTEEIAGKGRLLYDNDINQYLSFEYALNNQPKTHA